MKRRVNLLSSIAALHDAGMVCASFFLSLYLRLGEEQWAIATPYLATGAILLTVICLLVFWSMHLYAGLWRFASMRDMLTIAKAVTLSILIFAACMFLLTRLEHLPRSVLLINWLFLMAMLAAPRFAYRAFKDRSLWWEMTLEERAKIPVLLIGATHLAEQFIQETARNPRAHYHVVGILDDRPQHQGCYLQRIPIYGPISALPKILAQLARKHRSVHKLLIAAPELRGEALQPLVDLADAAALPIARIPTLHHVDPHFASQPTPQPIALEDLLGRPQVAPNQALIRDLITGKNILITGAGGSIGSELVQQILALEPSSLCLLDSCEYHLYQIQQIANPKAGGTNLRNELCNVQDEAGIEQVFTRQRPNIVFHTAAIKHVPIAEAHPEAAAHTNILGTKHVADACVRHGVACMVLISTDKAVHPCNVMGATKQVAERYVHALGSSQSHTCFVTVRFGNVLGSTGSVVPLFTQQIAKGGPITVTHPDITRYFMTLREAVELVLQAAGMGASMQETGTHIFVLDMGSPVSIMHLARQMIRLAGRSTEEIPIMITGLRPGEKLHEALFHPEEQQEKTAHPSITLARSRPWLYSDMDMPLKQLEHACHTHDRAAVIGCLQQLVPEFHPSSHHVT